MRCARVCASRGFSMGSFVPGTTGTSARWASWRPAVLEPSDSMASAGGPMKVRPVSVQARGNAAFSATNLQCWCASAKLIDELQILPLDEHDVIFFQGLLEFGAGDKIIVALPPGRTVVRVIQSHSL